MALGDKRRLLAKAKGKAKATPPQPAPRPPMVEETPAVPRKEAPKPPPRERCEAPDTTGSEDEVVLPPSPEEGPGPAPVSRGVEREEQPTMADKRAAMAAPPKVEVSPETPIELGESSLFDVNDLPEEQPAPAPKARPQPVEPTLEPQPVSVPSTADAETARAKPTIGKISFTARFSGVGDTYYIGAGLTLRLDELLSAEAIKVMLLGGQTELPLSLVKDVPIPMPCPLKDGTPATVVSTYTGKDETGRAWVVPGEIEGAAKMMTKSLSQVTAAASQYRQPSKWKAMLGALAPFLPGAIAGAGGVAGVIVSFTANFMKSLGTLPQWGIAAVCAAAAVVGFISITSRIDFNHNNR